jgi:hypothetical protein
VGGVGEGEEWERGRSGRGGEGEIKNMKVWGRRKVGWYDNRNLVYLYYV